MKIDSYFNNPVLGASLGFYYHLHGGLILLASPPPQGEDFFHTTQGLKIFKKTLVDGCP